VEKKFNLILSDSIIAMEQLIEEGIKVDMILCDLPYGTTACSWDAVIPFDKLWSCYKRLIKENGAVVLFGSQPFTTDLINSNRAWFKYDWIWIKNRPTGAQHSKNKPMNKHEHVLVFSKATINHVSIIGDKRMTYYPQGVRNGNKKTIKKKGTFSNTIGYRKNQIGKTYTTQTGFPDTILTCSKEEEHQHPTQKPINLMKYLIRTYTNENELVLDNTMGSGTTGVACMIENRKFIGIENNEKYFKIAESRIGAEENQIKLFFGEEKF